MQAAVARLWPVGGGEVKDGQCRGRGGQGPGLSPRAVSRPAPPPRGRHAHRGASCGQGHQFFLLFFSVLSEKTRYICMHPPPAWCPAARVPVTKVACTSRRSIDRSHVRQAGWSRRIMIDRTCTCASRQMLRYTVRPYTCRGFGSPSHMLQCFIERNPLVRASVS